MNLFKSFDSGLGQYMRNASRLSGGVESSNPCHWRGKRLHHHGGDVCCVFVLVSSGCCHSSYVDKYQNITLRYTFNHTIWLTGVTFCPTLACTIPLKSDFDPLMLLTTLSALKVEWRCGMLLFVTDFTSSLIFFSHFSQIESWFIQRFLWWHVFEHMILHTSRTKIIVNTMMSDMHANIHDRKQSGGNLRPDWM